MAGAHCDLGEKITVYADKQLCSQLMPENKKTKQKNNNNVNRSQDRWPESLGCI